ncbi:MAG: GNAT family N-acetyltransferase [Pseudomonadota bacterium]
MTDRFELAHSLADIPRREWDALLEDTERGLYPFLRYDFLLALEETGCVGAGTGWLPHYLLLYRENQLIGAAPAFVKEHSRGEFVFDWQWAEAYYRHGLDYYPKLLLAAPFTPAAGPRLLCLSGCDQQSVRQELLEQLLAQTRQLGGSGFHCLFANGKDLPVLAKHGDSMPRLDYQFHWHNRGYREFSDFVADLKSRKRKKLRRERQRVSDAGFHFRRVSGSEMSDSEWQLAYQFYASTFLQKGNFPWMNQAFFQRLGETMGDAVLVVFAYQDDDPEPVAGAINFCDRQRLYGRYWGCRENFHSLHFETCFYQGIEHCIEKRLAFFEPGAQGEHKIARGFLPRATYSFHWILQPDFAAAIADYLERERQLVSGEYADHLWSLSPFREDLTDEYRRAEEVMSWN